MKIGHSAEELALVFGHIYAKQQVDKIINYLKFNKLYRYVLVYFFFFNYLLTAAMRSASAPPGSEIPGAQFDSLFRGGFFGESDPEIKPVLLYQKFKP